MIAKYVDRLLAQRTGDGLRDNRKAKTVKDRNSKVSGLEDSVVTIL